MKKRRPKPIKKGTKVNFIINDAFFVGTIVSYAVLLKQNKYQNETINYVVEYPKISFWNEPYLAHKELLRNQFDICEKCDICCSRFRCFTSSALV